MKNIICKPWTGILSAAAMVTAPIAMAQTPVVSVPEPTLAGMLGSTTSSVQSSARPYGLEIVNPVQVSGSDANSASFNANVLPILKSAIATQLPESTNNIARTSIDPQKLTLDGDYAVRIYFISEGAQYRNTLGFNTVDPTTNGQITSSADAMLIFPNASNPNAMGGGKILNNNDPVNPGDFVNLGTFTAGTQLDFFIIAGGATGGTATYSTQSSFNPSGLRQAAMFSPAGSSYLLVGFEDVLTTGGDKDFNDLMFAVELVRVGAPEPSLAAGMIFVGLLGLTRRRRAHSFN